MAKIPYPPTMPLYPDRILHSRHAEERWANPLAFMDVYILVVLLFLLALWGMTTVLHDGSLFGIPATYALWIISLVPPVILLLILLLAPRMLSPVWPYQVALFQDSRDAHVRWNFAVVATAHIYCGHLAQAEWLEQMTKLSAEDRMQALSYIRRVSNRLQTFAPIEMADVIATFIAGVVTVGVSIVFLKYPPLYASLHGILLMVILELLMLALLLQRWQHVRRLAELEEIFEELMPPMPPSAKKEPTEDEVQRWYRERFEEKAKAAAAPPEKPKSPPVLWE